MSENSTSTFLPTMASESSTLRPSSNFLQFPPNPGFSFRRSSGSSTSSLSSTFSELSSSTSSSSSSPPNSKTNAFFASPFSTRPPSPLQPASTPASSPPRSLTVDFFATPVRPPSPPPSSLQNKKQNTAIHSSRIFPSRHTAIADRGHDYNFFDFDRLDETSELDFHERAPSTGSDSSFTSAFPEPRLPTPPPTAPIASRTPHREDTMRPNYQDELRDEPTPRPADMQPPLLRFERSMLLEPQTKPLIKTELELSPEPMEDNATDEDAPHPGSIISLPSPDFPTSHLPLSPLSLTFMVASPAPIRTLAPLNDRQTPTPTNDSTRFAAPFGTTATSDSPIDSPASSSSPPFSQQDTLSPSHRPQEPKLRLLRCLGHGAFSAVWLAEDLSRVPLTLVSKKSVKNLRRRASGRDKERESGRNKDRMDSEIPAVPTLPQSAIGEGASEAKSGSGPGRRPPSRLKEGLKNMLSFSRLSNGGLTSPPPAPDPEPSDFSLSRQSSIKSLPSNASDGSLSRTSSIASSKAPSRNSGLKVQPPNGLTLSRDSSLKKFRARVKGTRPAFRLGRSYLDERHGEMGEPRDSAEDLHRTLSNGKDGGVGLTASLSRNASLSSSGSSRLVAVKMTPRKVHLPGGKSKEREEEERTRVGFVREVEVLKHISHPNITPLLAHLSTPSHHILVLPYLPGGDLLGLVNNDVSWSLLSESVLHRIWCELCKAVGWMHGVGLVHRDIKLENILMTTQIFSSLTPSSPHPTLASLPQPPAPFIKLSDFGLSRFVEIDANGDAELLSTRCGSEAYAAPELVIGGNGVYDARKTDAWACGVVLYALVGRQLPFGEGVEVGLPVGGNSGFGGRRRSRIGGERGVGAAAATAKDRKRWLTRIAAGEWTWPDTGGDSSTETETAGVGDSSSSCSTVEELVGPGLVKSRGARRIVSRLLVRDPKKRARIGDLWDDAWMQGGEDADWWWRMNSGMAPMNVELGGGEDDSTPTPGMYADSEHSDYMAWPNSVGDENGHGEEPEDESYDEGLGMSFYNEPSRPSAAFEVDGDEEEEVEDEDEDEEVDGCLLDQDGIDSITRREVV
ncbi:kinase-like protein [Agrocybe pediades]|nr:kinase-like protein [Agrocybe pediades]